jgi:hypothetical protein
MAAKAAAQMKEMAAYRKYKKMAIISGWRHRGSKQLALKEIIS